MTRAMRLLAATIFVLAAPRLLSAQERGAVALGEAVAGLDVTGRVLLIGAHPDDEDTQLLTWLARGRNVETAYLSLTRGDGGQNLIGNELGPLLGMIRTEELLAARRLDGGRQFFTRAYDFGFSKTAEETYTHWVKDSILRDVVTVVRAFRPQIIVAVFSGTPRDGHGHHQVSGILAREAFDAAADTVRFPRSATGGLGAWSPAKFYRAQRFNPAGGDAVVQRRRAQSLPRDDVRRDRVGEPVAASVAGVRRAAAARDVAGLREARGVARLAADRAGEVDVRDARHGVGTVRRARAAGRRRARRWIRSPTRWPTVRSVENLAAPAPMVAPLARVVGLLARARARR